MLLALYEMVKADPHFKGPKGDPGTPANVDDIAAAVLAKMPAFVLQYTDKNDQVVLTTPFVYDAATNRMVVTIPPLAVETYNEKGELHDYDEHAIPHGIKVKPFVIPAKPAKPAGT